MKVKRDRETPEQHEARIQAAHRRHYEESKARNPPVPRNGFVYVMECPPLLRIGFSANPQKRLRNLFTDIPDVEGIADTLEVLATIPGGFDEERKLQHALDEWKYCGSWYIDCRELRAFLIAYGFADLKPTRKRFKMPETARWLVKRRDAAAKRMNNW
jgi:hypothetical protein